MDCELKTRTKTLIVVILDESGSMNNKLNDVLGGFNCFLAAQKKIDVDEARFIMVKFNSTVNIVHLCKDIKSIPDLNSETYQPDGWTALYDAIAEGVRLAEKAKTEDERVICVIMTDGEENSSRKTTLAQVRKLITEHENLGDWTFTYIGENPEKWAAETGHSLGNVASYNHAAPQENFMLAAQALGQHRSSTAKQHKNLFVHK